MLLSRHKAVEYSKAFFLHCFLITVAVACLFPLIWMARSALMTKQTIFTDMSLIPSVIETGNFMKVWTDVSFRVYFFNSIVYTAAAVYGIVLISSLAGFAFSRLRFPGKDFFFLVFFIAMLMPLPAGFVPLVAMMNKLGLANTRAGYILCMINVQLSISIVIYKTFFDKMSHDLEDAARIDGCGRLGIWWHVARPMARPATAVVVILGSMMVWNEFILAQLLLTDNSLMTLQTGLFKFRGQQMADYPVLMAGLTISVVPIIAVYLVMQKHIIKGLSSGGVFGQ